ncbi:TPR-like protein [Exidia glandulosa HHB12029]|uniref:TPR-like protein n=1 Tax=Exidia glandulosa HHB12029 TaxID=1314781 RepID=A0A165I450_EXIGL|nr:TPR-like protein [Exidia glandulosa HHB12029]
MASNVYLQQRFAALVWYCLDNELVRSATFYAERFFFVDTDHHDARHLLATAYLRAGQTHSALHLVNTPGDTACPGCNELKAKCCTVLGRFAAAREAYELARAGAGDGTGARETTRFPDEAILHLKAGEAAMKGNMPQQAVDSFRKALALNPLLWEAFEGLCTLGSFPDVNEVLPPRPRPSRMDDSMTLSMNGRPLPTASGTGFFTPDGSQASSLRAWKPEVNVAQPFRINNNRDSISTVDYSFAVDNSMQMLGGGAGMRAMSPPSLGSSSTLLSQPRFSDESGPAMKKARSSHNVENAGVAPTQGSKARMNPAVVTDVFSSRANQAPARGASKGAESPYPARRSTRLRNNTASAVAKQTNLKHPPPPRERRRGKGRAGSRSLGSDDDVLNTFDVAQSPSTSSVAPQSPRSEASPAPAFDAAAQEALEFQAADDYIYELMRVFARATRAMAQYKCMQVIQELELLPQEQQNSPSGLVLIARANYEMVDYAKAERVFQAVRSLEPYRIWDMEVYSTLLWHLRRNVQLSFLAQELLAIDSRAPEAWIAAGNCFSLQKERNQALTCFRRAAQLDPGCAYAYTLSGHESVDDDLEKAVTFFQSAIRSDPRHYNAWYGLGTCFLQMSKLRLAEYHYRRAAEIHPANAVLLGCVGMAVERRGATEEALSLFDQAIQICPDNALVLYRRAKILIGLRRYDEALKDLVRLRDLAPEESNVVFQLAKLYRLMGDEVRAAQHLAMARDISPKSIGKVRQAVVPARTVGAPVLTIA